MLQFHVTDDRGTVTAHKAEHFPFTIGRSARADLQLISAGVFEEHARIEFALDEQSSEPRYFLNALGQSLLLVNGKPVPSRRLAIGDEISIGAVRLVVSLAPPLQTRLAFHEWVVWLILALVVVLEALIIHFAR